MPTRIFWKSKQYEPEQRLWMVLIWLHEKKLIEQKYNAWLYNRIYGELKDQSVLWLAWRALVIRYW